MTRTAMEYVDILSGLDWLLENLDQLPDGFSEAEAASFASGVRWAFGNGGGDWQPLVVKARRIGRRIWDKRMAAIEAERQAKSQRSKKHG